MTATTPPIDVSEWMTVPEEAQAATKDFIMQQTMLRPVFKCSVTERTQQGQNSSVMCTVHEAK